MSVGDAVAAAAEDHADAVTDVERLAGIDLLDDGNRAALVEADADLDSLARVDVLLEVGAGDGSEGGTADGGRGAAGAAADLISEETTADTAEHGAGLVAALDFHVADGGDLSSADRAGAAGFGTGIGVTGEGILRARCEQQADNGEGHEFRDHSAR